MTETMNDHTNGHANGHVDGHVDGSAVLRRLRRASVPGVPGVGVDLAPGAVELDESPIWGTEMPDPEALRAAVDRAEAAVELQSAGALVEAKSPADIAADLAAARQVRNLERQRATARQRAAVEDAAAEAEHERRMRRIQRQAREDAARASVQADALTDPHREVARLHWARQWVPTLAAVPAVFALIAGAVNVGSQLHRLFPATPLVSWVIDPIITLAIVAIGAAHLYDVTRPRTDGQSTGHRNPFRNAEIALFVITSAAAVGLHYADGPGPDAAGATDASPLIWLSVPIGLGVSLWLVPKLRTVFTERLCEARAEARRHDAERTHPEDVRNAAGLHQEHPENTSGNTSENTVPERSTTTMREPSRRSYADHATRLRELTETGEIDPHAASLRSVRHTLGCGSDVAADLLRDEWGRTDITTRGRRR